MAPQQNQRQSERHISRINYNTVGFHIQFGCVTLFFCFYALRSSTRSSTLAEFKAAPLRRAYGFIGVRGRAPRRRRPRPPGPALFSALSFFRGEEITR